MPARKRFAFRYGKVWDERSEVIKCYDPSESVRSDEIMPILKSKFSHIDIRHFNGSILLHALDQRFYERYDPDREEDKTLLDCLLNIEKTMIDIGEISSDHAHIVATKEQ